MKKLLLSRMFLRLWLLSWAGIEFILSAIDYRNGSHYWFIPTAVGTFFLGLWYAKVQYDEVTQARDALIDLQDKIIKAMAKEATRDHGDDSKDADWWKQE